MERTQVHPRHVRIAHWINALVVFVLLWSGFAMFVADRHFAAIVHAVPAPLWSALQLTGHRMQGRAWHMGMAVAFVANAVVYAVTSLRSGTWRRIVPRGAWLTDAWKATLEELTAPRESLQRADYNAAQRLAYALVFAGGAVMIATGIALWFGRQFPWMLAVFGGERIALTLHVVLATGLLAFIVVHVLQVLRAGLPTLLAMITGSTANGPARVRRGIGWSAGVLASLAVAFIVTARTSGPSGIPAFLRWAVPSQGEPQSGERFSTASRHHRDQSNDPARG